MENVKACDCCGHKKSHLVYRQPDSLYFPNEWFSVRKCNNCGLGFVSPRPCPDKIQRYYPALFYETFKNDKKHIRRYQRQSNFLKQILKSKNKKPRLLDVGCAKGDFPRFMQKKGWEVEGIEISSNLGVEFSFPVYRKSLLDCNLPDEYYDAVTAWAVFEHLHNPKKYFSETARILKKNGLFVFLVTNFKSLSSYALFREDIPRHLHFFTEECVQKYLKDAGLCLVGKKSDNQIYEMKPANILFYLLQKARGNSLKWENLPQNLSSYLAKNKQEKETFWKDRIIFYINNPLLILDRIIAQIYERIQIINGNYGIATYIAKKL